MSNEHPIYAIDSDEDPSEGSYDSDGDSVNEDLTLMPAPTPNVAPIVDETKNIFAEPLEGPPLKKLKTTHLDWMPHLLKHWRMLEGIPSTYEIGESSQPPPPLTLTGEPIELTVPTLVAVIHTLFWKLTDTQHDVLKLKSDTSRLDGDMISTYERLELNEGHTNLDNEAAQVTRARVQMLEERVRVTEIVAGVSLMMTVMMAVVGTYLSYLR